MKSERSNALINLTIEVKCYTNYLISGYLRNEFNSVHQINYKNNNWNFNGELNGRGMSFYRVNQ